MTVKKNSVTAQIIKATKDQIKADKKPLASQLTEARKEAAKVPTTKKATSPKTESKPKAEPKPTEQNKQFAEMQKTLSELAKQVETLTSENKELKEVKPVSLEDRIARNMKCNELLKVRTRFDRVLRDMEKIKLIVPENGFELEEQNTNFALKFFYANDNTLTISNVAVIAEFQTFIIEKVKIRISEIEKEISLLEV